MKRIGLFVCHCGINIAGTIDVKRVVEEMGEYPGVVFAKNYEYMCSQPGQGMIKNAIKEHNLDSVVIACCSPSLHEATFRRAANSVGLNPYNLEIANIREQCSWVHDDEKKATVKAMKVISSLIEKVRENQSLEPISIDVTRRALVIGAGIAGIQSALDIADSGHEVILVEKEPSIGGHMAQLSETFPTLDCSQCILTPKMVEVANHPNIDLRTYSEVESVSGYVGNFNVKIKQKAAYVDWDKCTGCGDCWEKCPMKVPSEFEEGLARRTAIYIPFPQAVPNKPVIDADSCLYLQKGKCGICQKVCKVEAIDYEQEDKIVEEKVGAIINATGYDLYPIVNLSEYGVGKYKDVVNGLQFERLLSASGPTGGEIKRPSDGKVPKEIVFIQCAGSRDPENHYPYCSKICCMYTAKHAMLYKHDVPDGQPYVFYIDIRSAGKGYEEFVQRAQEEDGVIYLRGKVSKIFKEGDKIVVWGADTLTGSEIEIKADMVVLAMAVQPRATAFELANKLKINTDAHGFFSEAHPKLRPVETLTAGIFLSGAAQAPKDIPDTVAQASGTASKVNVLFSGKAFHAPIVATVNDDLCSGCKICVNLCPYEAREFDEEERIVTINEVLCEACGSCVAACPSGAASQKNFQDKQYISMIKAILKGDLTEELKEK